MPRPKSPRIWLLSFGLAAGSAVLYLTHLRHLPPVFGTPHLPWWAIAIALFLAEANVVHVHFRKDSESFSLSELPLVVGLFFVSPTALLLAQFIGPVLALGVRRRQTPMKLAFNLSSISLETAVAISIFRLVAVPGSPVSPLEVAASFLAAGAFSLLGMMIVTVAISLAEGGFGRDRIKQVFGFGALVSFTNASLGVLTVAAIRIHPLVSLLWVGPAVAMFFAYRAYLGERRQHERLGSLYDSTRALQATRRVEATAEEALRQAREMFRCDIASLTLIPLDGEVTHFTLKGDEELASARQGPLNPMEGVWARAISEGEPVVLPRPIRNERLRAHFDAQGIRDAVVVPLLAEEKVVGTLLVANRLGDVVTFGEEDVTTLKTLANHTSIALENARLIGELEASLERQTELNRLKDEFIATVSHELRTPLTSIQGFVKTMRRNDIPVSPDDQQTYLEIIERQSDRLRGMIEDLLLVSRIEHNQVRPSPHVLSLSGLMESVLQSFSGRGRDIQFDSAPLPSIESDEEGIHRIVANLIENAIKYSDDSSTIMVSSQLSGDGVTIVISDRGVGIDADEHERVFDRFFQVDGSSTRTQGGTGLGLYICRRLSEEIGGRVWLEKSVVGEGSTFCLWVPIHKSGESQQPPHLRSVG